jgi:hypothetical protein
MQTQEQELAELTKQVRAEQARLADLRPTADRAEAQAEKNRPPFIGASFAVGLILGIPAWIIGWFGIMGWLR